MNLFGSIRRSAARAVRDLQAQNATLRAARNPLWLRLLRPIIVNRSLLRLLGVYALVWGALVASGLFVTLETPAALAPIAADLAQRETIRDILSYMLGAQATMVGLIFPLALGMVTLIVQRDEGAATNADVQVYYEQSLAYAVGTSGIALAIALLLALLGPEAMVLNLAGRANFAASISLALLVALGGWLLINLLVTWQFLVTSLSFIRPRYRAEARKRFVAAHTIPRHLSRLLANYGYLAIGEELFRDASEPTPFAMVGAAYGTRGERAVTAHFGRPRTLRDIRRAPLRAATQLWAWRCRRAGEAPGGDKFDWMLGLAGPLGREFEGDVLICRRVGGVPLSALETWLIRRALVFGAPIEPEELGPSDILEELGDRVVVQIDRRALTGFDLALSEMREFHAFLLRAYNIVDEAGATRSYAAFGESAAEHANWVREYARLFERAVAELEREDSFLGSLAFMPANLMPHPREGVPAAIAAGLHDFPQYMVHRIGHWLTAQRTPRGGGLLALAPGALPPQIAKAYRRVATRSIGAHESALHASALYSEVPEGADEAAAWAALTRGWPVLLKHLESSAYLIVASFWHENDIGGELYVESFLRWLHTAGDVAKADFAYILRSDRLSAELLDRDWTAVEAEVAPLLLHPNFREALPATIFSALLANLHADLRVVTALILTGWAGPTPRIHGAAAIAKRLASTIAPRDGSALVDLVRTFVRLRFADWSSSGRSYVSNLDDLVRSLDAMTEGERIPGRVYSVDTRFRVGSLANDWFALLAALGDAAGFDVIAAWLGALGDDEQGLLIGDENLWQLTAWLTRTAAAWSEPASRAGLRERISALGPALAAEDAGDALHAALVGAVATIEAHRTRRLAALPISPDVLATLRAAAAAALRTLPDTIALFPGVEFASCVGGRGTKLVDWARVDKRLLVDAPLKRNEAFADRFARVVRDRAVRRIWQHYFKLRRRRVMVGSNRALLETAAAEGAAIILRGAHPILLLAGHDDWPDFDDAQRDLGDAVTQRESATLPESYLYSFGGVDVHRSGLDRHELLADDLLERIDLTAPDPGDPVELAAKADTDPTEVTLTVRLGVSGTWRDDEVVVLALRAKRTRKPQTATP